MGPFEEVVAASSELEKLEFDLSNFWTELYHSATG